MKIIKILILMLALVDSGLLAMQFDEVTVHNMFLDARDSAQIRDLVRQGMNINARDRFGKTPLYNKIIDNNLPAIKFLVENGANIDLGVKSKEDAAETSPLIGAIQGAYTNITQYLIEHGANLHAGSRTGNSALMWAALKNNPKIAKLLIEHGANIHATNNAGETALMWAAFWGGDLASVLAILTTLSPTERQNIRENIRAYIAIHFSGKTFPRDIRKLLTKTLTESFVQDHMHEIEPLILHKKPNGYTAIQAARDQHHDAIARLLDLSIPESRKTIEKQVRNNIKRVIFGKPITKKQPKKFSYYAMLQVDPSASQSEIKRAYRTLARRYHPDRAAEFSYTPQEAQSLMHQLNQAYEVLSDPACRHTYDQSLQGPEMMDTSE